MENILPQDVIAIGKAPENRLRTNGTENLPVSVATGENGRAKGGAPSGNLNRASHFLGCTGWPSDAIQDRRHVAALGRALRAAVLESGRALDIVALATIQSAQRHEKHARLAGRWLRLECAKLTPDQRLAFSAAIGKASTDRDKCIRTLGIDRRDQSVWDMLDATAAPSDHEADADDQDTDQHGSDAAASKPEALGGNP